MKTIKTIGTVLLIILISTIVWAYRDKDNDGIPDKKDKCDDTVYGAQVDKHGCSPEQFCNKITQKKKDTYFMKCWEADWRKDEPNPPLGREDWRFDCQVWTDWATEIKYCVEGIDPYNLPSPPLPDI